MWPPAGARLCIALLSSAVCHHSPDPGCKKAGWLLTVVLLFFGCTCSSCALCQSQMLPALHRMHRVLLTKLLLCGAAVEFVQYVVVIFAATAAGRRCRACCGWSADCRFCGYGAMNLAVLLVLFLLVRRLFVAPIAVSTCAELACGSCSGSDCACLPFTFRTGFSLAFHLSF